MAFVVLLALALLAPALSPSPTPLLTDADAATRLGDRIPLRTGMRGGDVRALQRFLRRAGQRVSVDGHFGRRTRAALRRFQRANGLPVNGVLKTTELSLLRQSARGAGGATPSWDAPATTPGARATVGADGLAVAPADAPDQVKQIIAAGNKIAKTPYVYGGGHGSWESRGYDCSGSVSYALHGVDGLLERPLDSGSFMRWGESGPGQWVTIYTHKSHMYMVVAGLRFDTSGRSKTGSRWQEASRSSSGFTVRHPPGL